MVTDFPRPNMDDALNRVAAQVEAAVAAMTAAQEAVINLASHNDFFDRPMTVKDNRTLIGLHDAFTATAVKRYTLRSYAQDLKK